jgi:LacI family transcriptional regulator
LTALGHERVAFAIDPISVHTVEGRVRSEAFLKAAKKAALLDPEVLVLSDADPALARYGTGDRLHTALVCFSDEFAGFLLASFRKRGVKVPEQVSVVGFDSTPFCETTIPRLTSVNQPVMRMAQEATGHLLKLIREAEEGLPRSPMASCIYDCGLDIRESTARPCAR